MINHSSVQQNLHHDDENKKRERKTNCMYLTGVSKHLQEASKLGQTLLKNSVTVRNCQVVTIIPATAWVTLYISSQRKSL